MKVKCIQADLYGLTLNKDYEVLREYVGFDGVPHYELINDYKHKVSYYTSRFALTADTSSPPKKRVRCIDPFDAKPMIYLNSEYNVEEELVMSGVPHYRLEGYVQPYRQNRFVVIDQEVEVATVNPTNDRQSIVDPEEARLWHMMRPSVLPHECICGIARADCVYHR